MSDPRVSLDDPDRAFPLPDGVAWHMHRGESLRFLRSLPNESLDALITDPPYSSGGAYRGDRTATTRAKYVNSDSGEYGHGHLSFSGDNRDQRSFLTWATLWLSEAWRACKEGAPVCLFTDWRQLPTMSDALQAGGFVWRGVFVWDKGTAHRPTMGRFGHQCEYVVWGSKGPMPLERGVSPLPGAVTHMQNHRSDKHHQTGKPTPVMREIVRICEPGGVICDPFAGSATTGVAALLEGYRFIGCELGDEYHRISRERLEAAQSRVVLTTDDTRPDAPQVGLFGGAE